MSLIVVEFSLSQKCFHKIPLEEMVIKNTGNTLKRLQTDYIPVAVFTSDELADGYIDAVSDRFKNYSVYKGVNGNTFAIDNIN